MSGRDDAAAIDGVMNLVCSLITNIIRRQQVLSLILLLVEEVCVLIYTNWVLILAK